jgi:hypothetical protein
MSEIEKARAGFVLSLLLFAFGLVMLDREQSGSSGTAISQDQTVAVCATTKGGLCNAGEEPSMAARDTEAVAGREKSLGSITVVAARLPSHLGNMLVLAPRVATELDARLRLATARGAAETEVIVAQ